MSKVPADNETKPLSVPIGPIVKTLAGLLPLALIVTGAAMLKTKTAGPAEQDVRGSVQLSDNNDDSPKINPDKACDDVGHLYNWARHTMRAIQLQSRNQLAREQVLKGAKEELAKIKGRKVTWYMQVNSVTKDGIHLKGCTRWPGNFYPQGEGTVCIVRTKQSSILQGLMLRKSVTLPLNSVETPAALHTGEELLVAGRVGNQCTVTALRVSIELQNPRLARTE